MQGKDLSILDEEKVSFYYALPAEIQKMILLCMFGAQ